MPGSLFSYRVTIKGLIRSSLFSSGFAIQLLIESCLAPCSVPGPQFNTLFVVRDSAPYSKMPGSLFSSRVTIQLLIRSFIFSFWVMIQHNFHSYMYMLPYSARGSRFSPLFILLLIQHPVHNSAPYLKMPGSLFRSGFMIRPLNCGPGS